MAEKELYVVLLSAVSGMPIAYGSSRLQGPSHTSSVRRQCASKSHNQVLAYQWTYTE